MLPNPVAAEMRYIAHALRRLGVLRREFTYDECLRFGELLRDCADALDHGAGPVTLPAPQEPAPQPEPAPVLSPSGCGPTASFAPSAGPACAAENGGELEGVCSPLVRGGGHSARLPSRDGRRSVLERARAAHTTERPIY